MSRSNSPTQRMTKRIELPRSPEPAAEDQRGKLDSSNRKHDFGPKYMRSGLGRDTNTSRIKSLESTVAEQQHDIQKLFRIVQAQAVELERQQYVTERISPTQVKLCKTLHHTSRNQDDQKFTSNMMRGPQLTI
jgi:uncharacterized coiled-coil protein SlyX